jgi:hypothetical protein
MQYARPRRSALPRERVRSLARSRRSPRQRGSTGANRVALTARQSLPIYSTVLPSNGVAVSAVSPVATTKAITRADGTQRHCRNEGGKGGLIRERQSRAADTSEGVLQDTQH